MIDDQLLKETASHVEQLLKNNDQEGFYFHNFRYFKEKTEEVRTLADQYQISDYYQKPLLLAAWLKDTGRLIDYKNPLKHSLSTAETFLRKHWVDDEIASKVTSLIQASFKRKAEPSLLDRILHDADIAYLGKKSFSRDAELLRVEYETLLNKFIDDYDWEKHKFKLLSDASFQTEAATKKYEKIRARNLKKQHDKMERARQEKGQHTKDVVFGRDIETFYRISFRNYFNHNSIIDRKANVMISINTLILAVIVIFSGIGFNFYYKLNDNYRFMAPIIVLLLSSLLSVIFAILAARPRVNGHKLELENMKENRTSFLNLENLLSISLQDFVLHMRELKNNHQWIFDNMSADLYLLGRNLNDKNRLLHWSYTIFMIGLGVSTLLFVFIFSDAITP